MINNTIITSSNTDIAVPGASATWAVVGITFCNFSASNEIITLHAIPSGGSAGDLTTVLKELTLVAKETYVWETKFLLGPNSKLSAIGTTGNIVSATVSYMSI